MYHGVNYVQVIGTHRSVLFIALTLTNFFEVWLEENVKKSRCWFSDFRKMFKNYFSSLKCVKIIVFKNLKLVYVYIYMSKNVICKIQSIFNVHAKYKSYSKLKNFICLRYQWFTKSRKNMQKYTKYELRKAEREFSYKYICCYIASLLKYIKLYPIVKARNFFDN